MDNLQDQPFSGASECWAAGAGTPEHTAGAYEPRCLTIATGCLRSAGPVVLHTLGTRLWAVTARQLANNRPRTSPLSPGGQPVQNRHRDGHNLWVADHSPGDGRPLSTSDDGYPQPPSTGRPHPESPRCRLLQRFSTESTGATTTINLIPEHVPAPRTWGKNNSRPLRPLSTATPRILATRAAMECRAAKVRGWGWGGKTGVQTVLAGPQDPTRVSRHPPSPTGLCHPQHRRVTVPGTGNESDDGFEGCPRMTSTATTEQGR